MRDLGSSTTRNPALAAAFADSVSARDAAAELRQAGFGEEQIELSLPPQPDTAPSPALHSRQTDWFGRLRNIFNEGGMTSTTAQGPAARAVVAVYTSERIEEAKRILEEHNGQLISMAAPEDLPASDRPQPADPAPPLEPGHIQLVGEKVNIRKERVERGEVRVRKETVTQLETVEVPVTREQLVVERTGDGGTSEALRVPLSEETVHVDKERAVLGEYRVGKRERVETRTVETPVRHEEIVVDDKTDRRD